MDTVTTIKESIKISNQTDLPGKKILVVEDEPDYAKILFKTLSKHNHIPHTALDGESALSSFDKHDFDIISLDYQLPDMNGIEVYRSIRKKYPLIPIIFVSGNFEFMQSMIDLKKEDSNVDFISKPFTTEEYINKIHLWCE